MIMTIAVIVESNWKHHFSSFLALFSTQNSIYSNTVYLAHGGRLKLGGSVVG